MDNSLPIYNSPQDDNQTQDSDGSNSLGVKPTSPASSENPLIPETPISEEQTTPVETLSMPEIQVAPEIPTSAAGTQTPTQPEDDLPEQFKVTEPVPKVVDRTEQITELHQIDQPGDALTKEADEEEKKFIEEVEKHHGNI